MNKFVRLSLLGVVLAAASTVPAFVNAATTINFDTKANGTAFGNPGDSFLAGEYAGLGVTVNDSDPSAGLTFVNLINPANIGTAISGHYVNVGAFAGVNPTFLAFDLLPAVQDLHFDFATPSGNLNVFAFGPGGFLQGFNFTGLDDFKNQAGFTVKSGSADILGVGPITGLVIAAPTNEALIVDNLSFNVVPEPGTYAFLFAGAGIALLLGRRRARR